MRYWLTMLLCLLAGPSWATTFYVKTTGNDSVTCTQAQNSTTPKLTIQSAVNCMTAAHSDTVLVSQGTYNTTTSNAINNPPSGTSTAYTIIKWDGAGSKPIINGSTTTNNPQGRGVLCDTAVTTCAYIEINGFDIRNMNQGIALVQTSGTGLPHHWRILNNICHDTYAQCFNQKAATTTSFVHAHLIQGNEFYNVGIWRPGYTSGNNTIYYPGNDTIVERNTFHNLTHGVGIWTDQNLTPGAVIARVVVRLNRFYDICREDIDTWQVGLTGGCAAIHVSTPGGGHLIYNNLIYNSGTAGSENRFTAVQVGTQADSTSTVQLYNNTFYHFFNTGTLNGRGYAFNDCATHCDGSAPDSTGAAHIVKNNIAYLTPFGFRGGTIANNLFPTNPSFVNAGAADFHLTLSSTVAINTGADLSGIFTTDFDGVTRPQGAAYDLGAYEFVPPGDVTPPAPPTGVRIQ